MKEWVWLPVLVLLAAELAWADAVVPGEQIQTSVMVRSGASTQSAVVGEIARGERARLLGSVPYWYEVELASGVRGFVAKRVTKVEVDSEGPEVEEPPPQFVLGAADVGTGLALAVFGPDFTLVYDGGSNDDLGTGQENRFLAWLRAAKPDLQRIDHMILSHPHRDHVELLPDLFGAFEVRDVWDSGAVNAICGYRFFLGAIRDEPGVRYHDALHGGGSHVVSFDAMRCGGELPSETISIPHAPRIETGQPIPLGAAGARMVILHADGSQHSSVNENSLVVRLDLGSKRVLLMGDAEAGGRRAPSSPPSAGSVERDLLECCRPELRADVLVVGHHGSRTSSRKEFLDAVGASTFLVSSGPKKYGSVVLPDDDVIEELERRGSVLRTDVDDENCTLRATKIGPDADGRAGGCDHIRVRISGSTLTSEMWPLSD